MLEVMKSVDSMSGLWSSLATVLRGEMPCGRLRGDVVAERAYPKLGCCRLRWTETNFRPSSCVNETRYHHHMGVDYVGG